MGPLTGLHGTVALILVSALLFAEESGVPLPLVPGDVLLIVAGLFIANGAISPWAFFPIAFLAVAAPNPRGRPTRLRSAAGAPGVETCPRPGDRRRHRQRCRVRL